MLRILKVRKVQHHAAWKNWRTEIQIRQSVQNSLDNRVAIKKPSDLSDGGRKAKFCCTRYNLKFFAARVMRLVLLAELLLSARHQAPRHRISFLGLPFGYPELCA